MKHLVLRQTGNSVTLPMTTQQSTKLIENFKTAEDRLAMTTINATEKSE